MPLQEEERRDREDAGRQQRQRSEPRNPQDCWERGLGRVVLQKEPSPEYLAAGFWPADWERIPFCGVSPPSGVLCSGSPRRPPQPSRPLRSRQRSTGPGVRHPPGPPGPCPPSVTLTASTGSRLRGSRRPRISEASESESQTFPEDSSRVGKRMRELWNGASLPSKCKHVACPAARGLHGCKKVSGVPR